LSAGISKDPGKFGEEYYDQSLDLVLRLLPPHRSSAYASEPVPDR
jgi:hypothetical protein